MGGKVCVPSSSFLASDARGFCSGFRAAPTFPVVSTVCESISALSVQQSCRSCQCSAWEGVECEKCSLANEEGTQSLRAANQAPNPHLSSTTSSSDPLSFPSFFLSPRHELDHLQAHPPIVPTARPVAAGVRYRCVESSTSPFLPFGPFRSRLTRFIRNRPTSARRSQEGRRCWRHQRLRSRRT